MRYCNSVSTKWGGVSIDTLTTEQSIVEDNDNTDEFNFIT